VYPGRTAVRQLNAELTLSPPVRVYEFGYWLYFNERKQKFRIVAVAAREKGKAEQFASDFDIPKVKI
jgi:hypothetical protein